MKRRTVFRARSVSLLLALLILPAAIAASAPAWLQPLVKQAPTFSYGKAKAAVLLEDELIGIDSASGMFTVRTRWAIKVLTPEGKNAAAASLFYDSSGEKVKSFQAWWVHPNGAVKSYGRSSAVDFAVYSHARELYGEAHNLVLAPDEDVEVGSVFSYEAVVEERGTSPQRVWTFAGKYPTELSTITVTTPAGWSVHSMIFNHEPLPATGDGRRLSWALRQLPAIEPEPLAPPLDAVSPWLALDLLPPAGARDVKRQVLSTWAAIADNFAPLYEQAAAPDAAIRKCADELTASAHTPWEKIRALCHYAQKATYISIDINASRAGGYLPRPAARVFQCNYGDCKEKTTLLRSLLRCAGFDSYAVVVFSGDALHVRPEWPSPLQFNHCITAIKLDDSMTEVPGATLLHPTRGRLLLFDPTNENVPAGVLPEEDAGGRGLILASGQGDLITLPTNRLDENREVRAVTAQLFADGSLRGKLEEHFTGAATDGMRSRYRSASASDYQAHLEQFLSGTLPGARASDITVRDNFELARFDLSAAFLSPTYGKPMRDTLLVFKPVILARHSSNALKKEKRTLPVAVPPESFEERTRITIPEGYAIDESFPAVDFRTGFGHYRAAQTTEGRDILFERSLELNATRLPVEKYEDAREFFEKILQAEQVPIVLRRDAR